MTADRIAAHDADIERFRWQRVDVAVAVAPGGESQPGDLFPCAQYRVDMGALLDGIPDDAAPPLHAPGCELFRWQRASAARAPFAGSLPMPAPPARGCTCTGSPPLRRPPDGDDHGLAA